MKGVSVRCIIVLLITVRHTLGFESHNENRWVDPHDMTVNEPRSHNTKPHREYKPPPSECPSTEALSSPHHRRLIGFILNLAKFDGSAYVGQMKLKISESDYKFLLQFVNDKGDVESDHLLRRVERVTSKILMKSKLDYVNDMVMSWSDFVYLHFFNRTTAIVSSCVFLMLFSYKLLKASFTFWSVVKGLLLLAWVVDFAFTWIALLQEAEINQMSDRLKYESVPVYCDPSKMSWYQYLLYSWSSSSECREYHKTLYKDTFYDNAPLQVISRQLGIVVYTPASHMGKAVGIFVSGMLESLPWGVNIILLPVLLVFVLCMICLLLSIATKTSFGINIAYLLQFHFGGKERHAVDDRLSGSNLSAMLNMHRNMIENVTPPPLADTVVNEETEPSTSKCKSEEIEDDTKLAENISE